MCIRDRNDNNDNEYSIIDENEEDIWFHPIPDNPNRCGLGLEVKVRGLQWQQILAQDNIFWVYEITNKGEAVYPRAVFGMLVGTYLGVTGDDHTPQEYADDWSFFDVFEDLTYTGDFDKSAAGNPFWQGPIGMVGYAFLESPGNAFDGIDNDGDADKAETPPSAPFFTQNDFEPVTFTNSTTPGPNETNIVVEIDPETFERTVKTFSVDQDTFYAVTLGDTIMLISGVTTLVEGNVVIDANTNLEKTNDNALDGKDNDLDGLIDENYFLHYRQRKVTETGEVLFDISDNPLRYVDYVNGTGLNDAMIDERRDDGIDNDNDWSRNIATGEFLYDDEGNLLDDVGVDGKPGTGDTGEGDGMPTAGEPNFDQTDKDESDQIGLTSFDYFVPSGEIDMETDVKMWEQLRPGLFSVPESFQDGRPMQGEDGDFVYGSGYFPLTPNQTERMSLALIYGWDLDDMIQKLKTVRKIYNSNYRFPIAPDKPKLTAVAGDNNVRLYWDRSAELSFDPVLREFDFEGYRVYRATDPNFNDARDVTNSAGNVVAYSPIAQFDKIDGVFGWYYPPNEVYQVLQGWSYNLGNETGLEHSYVDYDVINGRTYYYAVVAYDTGIDSTGVIPSECTKKITELSTGEVDLDVNTVKVTPNKPAAGYTAPKTEDELEHLKGDGYAAITYNVLDSPALTGHQYEVYFWDTSNDGIDNNNNWNTKTDDDIGADGLPETNDDGEGDGKPTPGEPNLDNKDVNELEAITTYYAVKDLYEYQEEFIPNDTNFVQIIRKNIIQGSVLVQDGVGNEVNQSLYEVNYEEGKIRAAYHDALEKTTYVINYQYHPVYFSQYISNSPWIEESKDSDIFDGLILNFANVWIAEHDTAGSGWNNSEIEYSYTIGFQATIKGDGTVLEAVHFPSNYEIRMYDHIVDTTSDFLELPPFPPTPRKFEIINTTGGYKIKYAHNDLNGDLKLSKGEVLVFFEKGPDGQFNIYTWTILVTTNNPDYNYTFQEGDVLTLSAKFPLNKFDLYTFQTELGKVEKDKAKNDLDNIRVVPNPYIVSHKFEPPLPPNVTSGRGERIIYFTKIPANAKIHIFTVRGEHLITLQNDDYIFNGTVTWNLKTKENLNIAYGVYFYVVESSVGVKKGKFAVIK